MEYLQMYNYINKRQEIVERVKDKHYKNEHIREFIYDIRMGVEC